MSEEKVLGNDTGLVNSTIQVLRAEEKPYQQGGKQLPIKSNAENPPVMMVMIDNQLINATSLVSTSNQAERQEEPQLAGKNEIPVSLNAETVSLVESASDTQAAKMRSPVLLSHSRKDDPQESGKTGVTYSLNKTTVDTHLIQATTDALHTNNRETQEAQAPGKEKAPVTLSLNAITSPNAGFNTNVIKTDSLSRQVNERLQESSKVKLPVVIATEAPSLDKTVFNGNFIKTMAPTSLSPQLVIKESQQPDRIQVLVAVNTENPAFAKTMFNSSLISTTAQALPSQIEGQGSENQLAIPVAVNAQVPLREEALFGSKTLKGATPALPSLTVAEKVSSDICKDKTTCDSHTQATPITKAVTETCLTASTAQTLSAVSMPNNQQLDDRQESIILPKANMSFEVATVFSVGINSANPVGSGKDQVGQAEGNKRETCETNLPIPTEKVLSPQVGSIETRVFPSCLKEIEESQATGKDQGCIALNAKDSAEGMLEAQGTKTTTLHLPSEVNKVNRPEEQNENDVADRSEAPASSNLVPTLDLTCENALEAPSSSDFVPTLDLTCENEEGKEKGRSDPLPSSDKEASSVTPMETEDTTEESSIELKEESNTPEKSNKFAACASIDAKSDLGNLITTLRGKESPSAKDFHQESPFECSHCGKCFKSEKILSIHVRVHSYNSAKPYTCKECGKAFATSHNLLQHMLRHSGERPYECGVCWKTFFSISTCQIHMRTHTGEKPYECKMCPRKFTQPSNLASHMKTHSTERPYQCKLCPRGFLKAVTLARHMDMHDNPKKGPKDKKKRKKRNKSKKCSQCNSHGSHKNKKKKKK